MPYYDRTYRLGFGGGLTQAVKYLLISNCLVFIFQKFVPLNAWFGMTPDLVLSKFYIWQLFTYMFLHGGALHLFFNMLFLWMLGCEVERALGTKEFLKFYLICGIGGGIIHLLVNYNSPVPVVGASGAIYGVMAAFGWVLFPERIITLLLFLFLPIQMKAKYLVMIFVGISLLSLGSNDGIAHFAHLGGAAVGFAYLKLDWRLNYIGKLIRRHRESRRAIQKLKREHDMQRFRERVDEILDKINEVGYDGLNDEEKRILHEASQQYSQEPETEN